MPKRKHRNNNNALEPRKVSETTALSALTNDLIDNNVKFYQYTPAKPVFLHKKELQEVVKLVVNRTKNLVISDDQLEEYTKRGNIITKLNKTVDILRAQRTQLHHEAQAAYEPFDKEMKAMIDQLSGSRLALKKQVDDLREQQRQQQINDLENTFNHLKEDFLKNDTSGLKYSDKTFSFANWFGEDNSKLRLSQKQTNIKITEYIANQAKDYQTFINLINKDTVNKEVLLKVFNENYVGDASEAYSLAQSKLLELERLEQMRQHQEQERQEREQERIRQAKIVQEHSLNNVPANNEETASNNNAVQEAKVGYVFTLYDPTLAKQLQDFMKQNGMQFSFETKILK